MAITRLRKPVLRRSGRLVIRIDSDGLSIRGHRKKKWRRVSWPEIAWLVKTTGHADKLFTECEGLRFLIEIGAT